MRLLKSRTFWLVFGFVLLIALVLLLGSLLEWSWTIRLLGIVGVLLLGMIVMGITFMRANRSSDQIEQAIKQQAQQQYVAARPDNQAEIQDLQDQLERAIEQLKQSKLGGGKRGRAALYALPWYMFIGPPGAGKTTAITNSGLNFPLGTDRVRGVGGTRNCDWFFTDSAILLDTAGRYMTEQEDTEEWLAFLDTLKEHRSERPINGVVVSIALPDLSMATMDEVEWHADNIRRRIDELVKRLGVRFPVFLAFTKSDMLQGFVEFFGEMSRREREQIWGCTLDDEQQASKNLKAVFEEELDRLIGALVNRRAARLSRSMKREDRQLVYAFPLQLASLKENLSYFVHRLFLPNPYQESPNFRGFYFTSGTQEGVPIDRVIEAVARKFELPSAGVPMANANTETKSYFIKDLFTDVMFPDQYMVRRTSKASREGTVRRWGVMAAAAVLLALFVLGTSQALVRSKLSLNEAQATASTVRPVRWDDRSTAVDNLATLDGLRIEQERLDNMSLTKLGLSRNGTVQEPIEKLYLGHARTFVQTYPLRTVEQRMTTTIRSGNMEGTDREILTNDLKAYLLLTEEAPRLVEEANRNFLVRHLTDLGTDELEPMTNALTRGELRAQVEPPVQAYVEALRAEEAQGFGADVSLISQARRSIYRKPTARVLYENIRSVGLDAVQPFTLKNAVTGRFRNLLEGDVSVPGFFTKEGWNTYVKDRITEMSKNPTGENWVMGRAEEEETTIELGSEDELSAELKSFYFDDYTAAWNNFIRGVRVKSFGDLRDAARSLTELGDATESPIGSLLASMTEETTFEGEVNETLQGLGEQVQGAAEREAERRARAATRGRLNADIGAGGGEDADRHPIDLRFQWLHALSADQLANGGASGDLYSAFTSLREVGSSLEGLVGDEVKAAEYVADVLESDGGDLKRAVDGLGRSLPSMNQEARKSLFEQPIIRSFQMTVQEAQAYLNDRWQSEVYEPFQSQLAEYYPFNTGSTVDAPILDAETYFAPQSGTLATFVDTELAPFIGRDIDQVRTWQGMGVRFSPAAVQAIKKARRIGETLYSGGGMQVSFELQPELPEKTPRAPAVDQVSLRLLGKEEVYQLGFQSWTQYDWPGQGDAVLRVSTREGEMPPKSFQGEWALFRLLDQARIQRRGSATEYELRWTFEQPGAYTITPRYNLRTRSSSNPFGETRGFFNFRPPASLN
ncbi:MAG TPA: type VI secretion system membrane subunit TssM [Rhodothermales bacterium]|nr:type VI secretion system membrane subunit TssM [Rhodothermales bacterium]